MKTVADLHPEALLDREARGELAPPDRARLDAHLAKCATCRFERQLRRDFEDDLESDVTPSAVESLLSAGAVKVRAPSIPPKRVAPPPRMSRVSWLLVAAAMLAASVAGASGMGQRALSRILGEPSARVVAGEAPAPLVHSAKQVARHHLAPPAPSSSVATPEIAETADVLVAVTAPAVAAVEPTRRAAPENGATVLFEEATEARRRGDYAQAITLQRELVARFPQSRESHVSRATMGRLLLDRGDPSAALASFDAYLAGGSGELGEEAMVGRATALERLGRSAEAAGAWQSLLAAYPNTPYAAHARARLGSMSER